jgi:metal-responsive CopG/Arc/MetJ family transcriptional regulator
MPKRVNVNFSDEVFGELDRIAKERGKSLSDVLRDAVTLEKYVHDTRQGGGKLLIWTPDGQTRELLVR